MCGIVGYIGSKQASHLLINGLLRLEYRGYDSAGVALINGDLRVYKIAGKVSSPVSRTAVMQYRAVTVPVAP